MKNVFSLFILVCSLMISCTSVQTNDSGLTDSLKIAKMQIDSLEHLSGDLITDKSGDLVKAESPDAKTKYEQGYSLPNEIDGNSQSPVNIITTGIGKGELQHLSLIFNGSIVAVENLGHTIQLDFDNSSTTKVNGIPYGLKQLHFHTPSEHLVDGMTFPMEMHIVSKLNDPTHPGASTYTVVGILFRIGHESKFLNEFLNTIPHEEGKANLDPQKINLKEYFAGITSDKGADFYHYQGSLTTPPYTESVNWIVRKQIFEASADQIAAIEKLEGNNARHIHALHNRKVTSE